MKIIVLNGSPKGKHSITLQYVRYIQKQFPQHEFKTIHIAQEIKKIENDERTFYDRAFFWSHTPSLTGKQLAYIISGPMCQNANLVQILEASVTARQNANFTDIITDESEDSETIDAQLQNLAERLIYYSEKQYVKPCNFLAIGGHKVFRDNIWGRLRGIWQADHRYYKKNGLYDFPQKNLMIRIFNAVLLALTIFPGIRKKYYANIKYFPVKRYEKLIERIGNEA